MKRKPEQKERFFKRKISLPIALTVFAAVFAIIFLQLISGHSENNHNRNVVTQTLTQNICNMNQVRLNDYKFTHPLLLTDMSNESDCLSGLKVYFNYITQQKKQDGSASSVSVYVRKLNDGSWVSLNGDESFNPGSIIKVAALITYLKSAESNPGMLDKEIFFAKPNTPIPSQTFKEKPIEPGKKYKVKDLLYAMIINSDNYATYLLNINMDIAVFKKLFTDLKMDEPDVHNPNFLMTVADLAKFMRVLYSGTYLNNENSEFALQLLSKSTFKDGLVKAIPADVTVSHKFGEFSKGAEKQLHEAGIVYIGENTYLLVVMTKGSDVKRQAEVISEISKHVFDYMTGKAI